MTDEITTIELLRVELPLAEPYHLSSVTVETFDSTIIRIETDSGAVGIGEVTTLEGYSAETAAEAWESLSTFADRTVGLSTTEAVDSAEKISPDMSFTKSAVRCALFGAEMPSIGPLSVPVVGILSTDSDQTKELQSLQKQVAAGFETIKVKIGFDPRTDAIRLQSYVDAAPDNVEFRVDANQGYDLQDAETFLDAAPLDRLQVVEQPLPVGQLEDHATLQAAYDTTIMLDEEIRSIGDLEAAASAEAAGAVKFKLMKVGSVEATIDLINRARQLGFEVVLGNGVQSEVGCLYEAMIWNDTDITLAGEFNGWLKQQSTLVDDLGFNNGHLKWPGGTVSSALKPADTHVVDFLRRGL